MTDSDYSVVLSTCATKREAEQIAERLVADGSAACVNIIDKVTSVYRWKGKIEKGGECLLIIKTRAALTNRVIRTIEGFSSYDCPEAIVIPVIDGSPDYLRWIDDATEST